MTKATHQKLANIAREVGADVLVGALRYPSETGGWQQGELDLSEYLDQYREHELVLIIAPLGAAPDPTYTCDICGFVVNEVGECPRCKLIVERIAGEVRREGQVLIDHVRAFLSGDEDDLIDGK